jgi:hypothetical protein
MSFSLSISGSHEGSTEEITEAEQEVVAKAREFVAALGEAVNTASGSFSQLGQQDLKEQE